MLTETMVVTAVRLLHGRECTVAQTTNTADGPIVKESTERNALPPSAVLRSLLSKYGLADAEATVRWLEIGEYVGYSGWGLIAPKQLMVLTDKGVQLAESGRLEAHELEMVYREDPYSVFVARQFRDQDSDLFSHLRDEVLRPIGLVAIDGNVDGIEAFRGEILRKISLARYFVCLLTRRAELASGGFASSVWLYQEIGAAVALGKRPLVLVEDGIDSHFAGELQKNYEFIPFTRNDFADAFLEVSRRISGDMAANHIPRSTTAA